jgi:hypothetical protein
MPVIIPAERRFGEPEIATARTSQKWGQVPFFPVFVLTSWRYSTLEGGSNDDSGAKPTSVAAAGGA